MKSRIIQALILLVIFVVALVLFHSSGTPPTEDYSTSSMPSPIP